MNKFNVKLTFDDLREREVQLPVDLVRQVARAHSKAEMGVLYV